MTGASLIVVVFGILAALANVLGGVALLLASARAGLSGLLKYVLAIGAGFMLAVTFVEVIPKTIELWQNSRPGNELTVPMLLLLAGYLLTQFFEHTIAPHFHLAEDVAGEAGIDPPAAYAGVGAFLVHGLFDGISLAAAAQIDTRVGVFVFLAVLLHKFPEGFTISSILLAAGKGSREVIIATILIGTATVVGVLGFNLVGDAIDNSAAYALPLASGVTLYVAASDLIPEVNHHTGSRPIVSLSVFAGVGVFFLLHSALHFAGQ